MMPFFDDDEFFGDLLLMGAAGGVKAVEATATGNPLTFQTDLARPLRSLLIPFTPVQSGTGDPSPQNVRPIVPWNGLKVYHSGADTSEYTETDISFPSPVYGGTLDVVSGVLRVQWAGFTATWGDGDSATDMGRGITRKIFPMVDYLQTGSANNMCNIAPYNANESANVHFYYSGSGSTNRKCRLFLPSDTPDSTEVTVITKLSQTYEVQLTGEQITALKGDNTIWSDADGSMTAVYLKKG